MKLTNEEYETKPLPQLLSKLVPYGSEWVIESSDSLCQFPCLVYAGGTRAPTISCDAAGPSEATRLDPFSLYQEIIDTKRRFIDFAIGTVGFPNSPIDLSAVDSRLRTYLDASSQGLEFAFWAMEGCGAAGLKITHWDYDATPNAGDWVEFDATVFSSPQERFSMVRKQLQSWLDVSVDELAKLLDLSPTTVVNLTKPGRDVRPKTVRKMMVVYGLLNEFQRVMGSQKALTWARTVGYRLLVAGDLREFEQYISTHIFPTLERRPRGATTFGDNEAELVMKPSAAVGRPSRI
jgi:plasmid maintenance system antidote protein VapI